MRQRKVRCASVLLFECRWITFLVLRKAIRGQQRNNGLTTVATGNVLHLKMNIWEEIQTFLSQTQSCSPLVPASSGTRSDGRSKLCSVISIHKSIITSNANFGWCCYTLKQVWIGGELLRRQGACDLCAERRPRAPEGGFTRGSR